MVALVWLAGCEVSRPPVARQSPRDPWEDPEDRSVPWPPPGASPRVEPAPVGRWTVEREIFSPEDRPRIAGVAFGDCDDDGMLDLVTIGQQAPLMVYRGLGGGRFVPALAEPPTITSRAATFVDLDRDGAEDLVTADEDVAVYRNLGGCRFAPRRVLAPSTREFALQVLAADANLDGLTDLSVARRASVAAPLRLLVARGDGSYDDVAPALTPYDPAYRMGPEFYGFGGYFDDVDDDGAPDLFALVDQWQSWFSWGVTPGGLIHRRDEALTPVFARCDPMSLAPIDFDRDGRVDWFAAGVLSQSRLLWHRGGRVFHEVAEIGRAHV